MIHLLIVNGWIQRDFIDAHTVGFQELEKVVGEYTPQRVSEICGTDKGDGRTALCQNLRKRSVPPPGMLRFSTGERKEW